MLLSFCEHLEHLHVVLAQCRLLIHLEGQARRARQIDFVLAARFDESVRRFLQLSKSLAVRWRNRRRHGIKPLTASFTGETLTMGRAVSNHEAAGDVLTEVEDITRCASLLSISAGAPS